MKLSFPMLRVLKNLSEGKPAHFHCRSQSDYGGLFSTLGALWRRGLIRGENKLTAAGRRALAEDGK